MTVGFHTLAEVDTTLAKLSSPSQFNIEKNLQKRKSKQLNRKSVQSSFDLHASQEISEQLQRQGVRCSTDVEELYLAHSDLNSVHSLASYKSLHVLWLNANRILKVDFLQKNYQLTELYLQENMIISIAGALKHLTCLQVLLLHANQLTCKHSTISELKHMLTLKTLNLFGNPLSQEEDYRLYVIFNVPSLQLLDRKSVNHSQVCAAKRLYAPECVRIDESIKFGRREFRKQTPLCTTLTVNWKQIEKIPDHKRHTLSPRKKGSPMTFSLFDWEQVGSDFLYTRERTTPSKITVSL